MEFLSDLIGDDELNRIEVAILMKHAVSFRCLSIEAIVYLIHVDSSVYLLIDKKSKLVTKQYSIFQS